jgi:anti-anti-sigma factor
MELTSATVEKFRVITIAGKVDWESAGLLDAEIVRRIDAGELFFAFDLNAVTHLSSGGIGAIAFNTNLIRSMEGDVHLISSNEYVNDIFERLRLTLLFEGRCHRTSEEFTAQVCKRIGIHSD